VEIGRERFDESVEEVFQVGKFRTDLVKGENEFGGRLVRGVLYVLGIFVRVFADESVEE